MTSIAHARMTGVHRFGPLDEVVYGQAFADAVASRCDQLGVERVAILSTQSLQGTLCETLSRALGRRHATTFAGIGAHTPVQSALDATRALRAADVQAFVALGGGSVIDGAKAVAWALWRGADGEEA